MNEVTSYFYTLIALGSIGLVLTSAFQIRSNGIKAVPERDQLKIILETISSEATELVAFTLATSSSSNVSLSLPSSIGDKAWWVRLASDSEGCWVEGDIGDEWPGHPDLRAYLPANINVSGDYTGGVRTPMLSCSRNNGMITLTLSTWEGS